MQCSLQCQPHTAQFLSRNWHPHHFQMGTLYSRHMQWLVLKSWECVRLLLKDTQVDIFLQGKHNKVNYFNHSQCNCKMVRCTWQFLVPTSPVYTVLLGICWWTHQEEVGWLFMGGVNSPNFFALFPLLAKTHPETAALWTISTVPQLIKFHAV